MVVKDFSGFKKQKDFLLCVDSDGCVMDTMSVKHNLCFGPCLVEEWELHSCKEDILALWNKINLYSITRGINRFKGLAIALTEINEKYKSIIDVKAFTQWAERAPILSNGALREIIAEQPDKQIFKKALSWSNKVNFAISRLQSKDKLPFPGAKEALSQAGKWADVALISSANKQAVIEEWLENGLLDYPDVVMTQNDGSKSDCIRRLIKSGYDKDKALMCGDSLGDLEAAKQNEIYFFPIIACEEVECWNRFTTEAFPLFLSHSYGEYEKVNIERFYNKLNK